VTDAQRAMQEVLVLGDERKGGSRQLVEEFAAWLGGRGVRVDRVLDRESSLERRPGDLAVVFGGDGSLLAAARRMGRNQRPTLGINVGRLGFLTAFEADRAREAVGLALEGRLHEEQRLLLLASVREGGAQETQPVLCLNDGVVSRSAVGGMITLRAFRSGTELATFRGDGLIVATAAGSTAYSLSSGGPVLAPGLDALVLTPLASHSLAARPFVLPVGDGIELEVLDTGELPFCHFQVDGQVVMEVRAGASAVMRPAGVRFRHLVPDRDHFFRVLRQKLGFADLPRPG
jgi:NAD+ kinase